MPMTLSLLKKPMEAEMAPTVPMTMPPTPIIMPMEPVNAEEEDVSSESDDSSSASAAKRPPLILISLYSPGSWDVSLLERISGTSKQENSRLVFPFSIWLMSNFPLGQRF